MGRRGVIREDDEVRRRSSHAQKQSQGKSKSKSKRKVKVKRRYEARWKMKDAGESRCGKSRPVGGWNTIGSRAWLEVGGSGRKRFDAAGSGTRSVGGTMTTTATATTTTTTAAGAAAALVRPAARTDQGARTNTDVSRHTERRVVGEGQTAQIVRVLCCCMWVPCTCPENTLVSVEFIRWFSQPLLLLRTFLDTT
jgi:hypothetical protein